tara:strand:+ start:1239 stop:1613 length:375 start_codon:yes stop_codon:yes gene_type:complete
MAIVPDVVIVPPDKPVPAVILVTVPDPALPLDIRTHADPVHTFITLEVLFQYKAPVKRVFPSLSTEGAVALEPKYLSSKESRLFAALVALVAALEAEVAAFEAEVEALLAEVAALVAEVVALPA